MEENNNGQNNMNENMQQNNMQNTYQNNQANNMNANYYAGQNQNSFNNTNIKNEAKEATGLFSSFFKDPLGKIEEIAKNPNNKYLKIAIVVFVIWIVIIFASNILSTASTYLFGKYGSFDRFFDHFFSNFGDIIKDLIAPVGTIAVISLLTYAFSKQKNKSFMHVATCVTMAKVPVVIAKIVSLLTLINIKINTFTIPFASLCSILSTVLLFFAIKNIIGEQENKKTFWKFALVMGIYYAIYIVLSFLEIYI